MKEQEMDELIALGHEVSGVEFKSPGPRVPGPLLAMIIRAAMGMSNRRDGGLVVIGVDDADNTVTPVGLGDEDLATWIHDEIATTLSEYADPAVQFTTEILPYRGLNLVVLHVHEFAEIPVLCKKPLTVGGHVVLRLGACYVRSRRKPETAEVSTQEDMRELIELGTEKRLNRWVAQAQASGLITVNIKPPVADADEFRGELGSL